MSDQDQYTSSGSDLLPGQLFDRDMEEALIGAVLINQDVYLDVAPIVEASDFYYKIINGFGRPFSTSTPETILSMPSPLELN